MFKKILEFIKILILKSRGYKPFDGLIPEKPPKKALMFGGVVDPKRKRIMEIIKERDGWKSFLSIFIDEQQRQKGLETMRCTTQGLIAMAQALFNLCVEYKLFSKSNIEWLRNPLKDNSYSYFDKNGKINFSERHIAKLSFTSKNGNLDSKVLATAHHYGLVPESMCKWEDWMDSWNEYYTDITQAVINVGYEFKKRFPFFFKLIYVPEFEEALETTSPVGTYVYGGYVIRNGVVQYSDRMSNHKICLYDRSDLNDIQDSYKPFLKKFVKNYPFYAGQSMYTGKKYSYGYKITFLENIIIKKKMIKVIKQNNQAEYYAIDEEAGEINGFGGWESYVKFLNAKWCEEVLEVKNKYLYLKEKYGKSFKKGLRIGVIK